MPLNAVMDNGYKSLSGQGYSLIFLRCIFLRDALRWFHSHPNSPTEGLKDLLFQD